jgi:pimeloyl-ACP methyl ester carboxylesterase
MSITLPRTTLLVLVIILAMLQSNGQAYAQGFEPYAPHECKDGIQHSGAVYRICLPGDWDGKSLVIYAHGYVSPMKPVAIPEDQVKPPGWPLSIDQVLNAQGYAFAMSSYSTNGLAVEQGIADSIDVLQIFTGLHGAPEETSLFGISDGGQIAVLAAERYPHIFRGAIAFCGPYGDYAGQINYFGDFRVLFDYFFPAVDIPNSPIDIAPAVIADWPTFYADEIHPIITDPANAGRVDQLLTTANVAFDADDAGPAKEQIIERLLWYNVFATNDGRAKLSGQPFDNTGRIYSGSADDSALNSSVERFRGDADAAAAIANGYETTGNLRIPLLTMHTDGDPIVPYWHAQKYGEKVAAQGSSTFYAHIPVTETYGHCSFNFSQLSSALTTYQTMLETIAPFEPVSIYLPFVATAE